MPDKEIVCKDCGNVRIFTEDEQRHFEQQGYQEPKRCKDCARLRKNQIEKGG